MDYHVMSEDIARLMSHLNISQANLIGHSMGGKVAMVLALTQVGTGGKAAIILGLNQILV